MYSDPGELALGFRARSNYQGWIDRSEAGFATSIGKPDDRGPAAEPGAWRNLWFSVENPTLWRSKPLNGVKLAAWHVDDAVRVDLSKTWDVSRFLVSPRATRTLGITAIKTDGLTYLDPAQWDDVGTYEISLREERIRPMWSDSARLRATAFVGWAAGQDTDEAYLRGEVEARWRKLTPNRRWSLATRGFLAAVSSSAPRQRQFRLSAQDPVSTFANHFLRPAGSPLARPSTRYTSLGGGALRGYDPRVAASGIASLNIEGSRRLVASDNTPQALVLWLNAFVDIAEVDGPGLKALGDAGVGLAVRGMLFDRPIAVRFDVPLYLSREDLAIDGQRDEKNVGFRWTFSFTDLW